MGKSTEATLSTRFRAALKPLQKRSVDLPYYQDSIATGAPFPVCAPQEALPALDMSTHTSHANELELGPFSVLQQTGSPARCNYCIPQLLVDSKLIASDPALNHDFADICTPSEQSGHAQAASILSSPLVVLSSHLASLISL
jgi:hypothetical protein